MTAPATTPSFSYERSELEKLAPHRSAKGEGGVFNARQRRGTGQSALAPNADAQAQAIHVSYEAEVQSEFTTILRAAYSYWLYITYSYWL
jgi:hypothetical protein